MVSGGKQVLQWQREQAKNLAANLGEYFSEETKAIARRQEITEFCAEVAQQDEALGHLEARIAALEQKR
jgi:ubiquinone biosynthesis protein UbiJ